jgi:hypothetical protein
MSREAHVRFWEGAGLQCPALLNFQYPDGCIEIRVAGRALPARRLVDLCRRTRKADKSWVERRHVALQR